MIEVECMYWDVSHTLEVVRELKHSGLVQGQDFDFTYVPPIFNSYIWEDEPIREKKTVFKFYNDELATWFELKYK